MGGTFDPLHWAHLVAAETARVQFRLDRVLFIPAGEPPHKSDSPISDVEDRYAMTLLGTADNPHFEVSRMEIDRQGPSYSVDTIRALKGSYSPDVEVYFIMGADEALDLGNWHEAEALPSLAHFLAAPRPGFHLSDLRTRLPECFQDAVELLPMSPVDLSSTKLRAKATAGESIKYLVPENVESYIRKHGLYAKGIEK
jgi:nicotinate-nucleotide adenylyltransferase